MMENLYQPYLVSSKVTILGAVKYQEPYWMHTRLTARIVPAGLISYVNIKSLAIVRGATRIKKKLVDTMKRPSKKCNQLSF